MSRTLRRPMFKRGGSTNDGIMSGFKDREQLANGTRGPAAVGQSARDYIEQFEPLLREFTPKTRLPIGAVGAALVGGTPIKEALAAGYGQFVKRDDAREAAIRKGAVSMGLGQALKDATPSKNILTNRKKAIVNIKARGLPLTEDNIIKETARLNKIDETGKSLSPDRVLAGRESLYLQSYGDGSKARNHAVFDINVAPEIRKAGKNPRGRIKFKDGKYVTKRKMPGVYIDVDNGKVIEITPELEAVELTEFSALLR